MNRTLYYSHCGLNFVVAFEFKAIESAVGSCSEGDI